MPEGGVSTIRWYLSMSMHSGAKSTTDTFHAGGRLALSVTFALKHPSTNS
jgi:hypothetical protein